MRRTAGRIMPGTCQQRTPDLRSGFVGAIQQLLRAERRFAGPVFVFYAVPATGFRASARAAAGRSVDRACGLAVNPIAPALVFRSIRAAHCNKLLQLPRSRRVHRALSICM